MVAPSSSAKWDNCICPCGVVKLPLENHGVAPDIDVEEKPADWRNGRDPQLERAVEVALAELQKHPPTAPVRPKPPACK
jgi:hypothetical protein